MVAGAVLLQRLRSYDVVGELDSRRLGAILPETQVEDAWSVADKVVKSLGDEGLAYTPEVYSYPYDWSDPESIDHLEETAHRARQETTRRNGLVDPTGTEGTKGPHPFKAVRPTINRFTIRTPAGQREEAGLLHKDQRTRSHPGLSLQPLLISPLPKGKRLVDIAVSATLLTVLSPLLLLCAILIKLTSRGKVFYICPRAGIGGVPFNFYKFRTMHKDASKRLHEFIGANKHKDGPIYKNPNDPRVTRLGRILRGLSIDELPQLFNVLKGDMTLVGPRPPLMSEVAEYEPWQMRRLEVTGGLTCLWQVRGRSNIPFVDWMRMDIEYIQNRSLALDFKLLLLTPGAVLSRRGAY